MASADEYAAWIIKNADKRGSPEFDVIARAYQDARQNSPAHQAIADQIANDTISVDARRGGVSDSALMNFAAGYGKAVPDLVYGIGQRLGLADQATIDERKHLDAPLMATKAGTVGNIGGNVSASVPTVFIPGAASIPGAAIIGGAIGAAQPTATGESALKNTAIGAALGGGSVLAGNLIGAGYRGLKAVVEPFTKDGPQRIAGRTLQRFAEDPSKIAAATNKPTITGALPTLAEQTGDAGLARLQDSLRSVDPQIENSIGLRLSENNAARVNVLRDLAGKDGARDFAVANRNGTAEQLYGDAFKADAALTPSQLKAQADLLGSSKIGDLMKSPAIQDAMAAAKTNAANAGKPMGAEGSIEGLHNMKLAIDDMIKDPATAAQAAKVQGLKAAREKLVNVIETLSPDYKTARTVYADMSKPVNQMDIAGTIADKVARGGTDLRSGLPSIRRGTLNDILQDEPALMKQATGRNLGKSLADVMTPEQLAKINAVAAEADRAGAVATAGNGPGSATAQRLASQNILRQVMTPNGSAATTLGQKMGNAIVDNTLTNTVVGKATNWLYSGIAEPKIQNALARAVLNPEEAQAALAAAQKQGVKLPDNLLMRLLSQARRATSPATAAITGTGQP